MEKQQQQHITSYAVKKSPRAVQIIDVPESDFYSFVFFGFICQETQQQQSNSSLHYSVNATNNNSIFASAADDHHLNYYYYYGLDFSPERGRKRIEMYRLHFDGENQQHAADECIRRTDVNGEQQKIFLNLDGIFGSPTPNASGTHFYALRSCCTIEESNDDDPASVSSNNSNSTITLRSLYKVDVQTWDVSEITEFRGDKITLTVPKLNLCWHHLHFVSDTSCFLKFTFLASTHFYRRAGIEDFHRQVFATKIYSLDLSKNTNCRSVTLLEFPTPRADYLDDFDKLNEDCRVLKATRQINICICPSGAAISGATAKFYHLDYCNKLFVFFENRQQQQNNDGGWIPFALDTGQNELTIDGIGRDNFRIYFDHGCLVREHHSGFYFKLNIDFDNQSYHFTKLFRGYTNLVCNNDATLFLCKHWKCFEMFKWNLPPRLASICFWKLSEMKNGKFGLSLDEEVKKLMEKYPTEKALLIPMNRGILRQAVEGKQIVALIQFLKGK